MSPKSLNQLLSEYGYEETYDNEIPHYVHYNISQENALKAFKNWLAGKLIAGNEKATPSNDVILKLLAEIEDGEYKP